MDDDGLIEIYSPIELHNMRYDLTGASYKTSTESVGNSAGCPEDTGCKGYELMENLDFDGDKDGRTWSGSGDEGFRLDEGDSQADYFPVDESGTGGWLPIGDEDNPFAAVFDGNGRSISNLAIRRDQTHVGLFGTIGNNAAIRNLGLIDNLADYTGSSENPRYIGGLVGQKFTGSITASYATGAAAGGGGGGDRVGGLVGSQDGGSITASYATGPAAGSGGDGDMVGGLVGRNGGSITASYATGAVAGGDGTSDDVGGLVGTQIGGSITASYAMGTADGGGGNINDVGGLVGFRRGDSITASYGFGRTTGGSGGSTGSPKPPRVSTAAQLTADNAGSAWDDASSNTLGAWNFGDETQIPALNYADYDGDGNVFDCDDLPTGACTPPTPLPGQDDVRASGPSSEVEPGATVSLAGSLAFGRVSIESWSWQQLAGPEVALSDATASVTTFTAPATRDSLVFELTATDSDGRRYTRSISLAANVAADNDGDGLIEIYSLIDLHNMRHNLAGTSYSTSTASVGSSSGCPEEGEGGCRGYELMQDLDFDVDGDGGTWSGNGDEGFRLDEGDSQADYFPVDEDGAGGWLPIGDEASPFTAVFDGNSHTISNLAIRRSETFYVGLFGRTGAAAVIRNIGLVDNLADYSGSSDSDIYIGGLVGRQSGGSITASYATGPAAGGDGGGDSVGGLVGRNDGSITASYATGAAVGGDGDDDFVGGLVGALFGGSITASYATGAAVGGDGDFDSVGGLVGWQFGGSITASYATGAAVGGDGDEDYVGGLVGQQNGGSITASYATGPAAGGDGDLDLVGGLVGWQLLSVEGSITASYGFGALDGERTEKVGLHPTLTQAVQLTADNAGPAWNDAGSNTLGAWDFGDETQIPALNYADYDGDGDVFGCDPNPGFPANVCGTLLPGQDEASVSGPSSALKPGAIVRLTGSPRYGRIGQFASFSWRQLAGPGVALSDAAAQTSTFTAPKVRDLLVFELTATAGDGREYRDRISLGVDVDRNDNGLIEIDSLLDLHNMRYNLKGTSYKTSSATSVGNSFGCPDRVCKGYELMQDLDFDGDDDDGGTWSGNGDEGYTLDSDDHQADYFPVDEDGAGGWLPIGNGTNPFAAVFDGNGNAISNLAIRRGQMDIGLFAVIGEGAAIRNLGLIDNLAHYSGTANGGVNIGGLVGLNNRGSIAASYATGAAAGGDGEDNAIGGLVGSNAGGSITASYATGAVGGGDGDEDSVGGLVGWQRDGSITASYATGAAAGGDGGDDYVGGLVGRLFGGSITASYATGAAVGGDGGDDYVGGLVGWQFLGSITASYATGVAVGGDGDGDYVGGLVGTQYGGSSITASYATGAAVGGDGDDDSVGGLVGYQDGGGMITASYATGPAAGGDGDRDYVGGLVGFYGGVITASYGFGGATGGISAGSAKPPGVDTAARLTADNAGSSWDDAGSNTLGAWDFGTETQIPALQYADYDGDGDVFGCAPNPGFPANVCGTLLPGQDEASVSGPSSALEPGATVMLAGSPRYGRIGQFASFSWRQLAGPGVAFSDAAAQAPTFTAPEVRDLLVFELTATAGDGREYRDRISLGVDVDRNDNGLIEIDSLLDLHYMRYNLKGTSYKTSSTTSVGNSFGCPDRVCKGYELMQDLDFDGDDDDGGTWSVNDDGGYTLDSDDHHGDYFPVASGTGGWLPIGEERDPFAAVFDGNGHSISNLAIRREQTYVGLFGRMGSDAAIRNLGLIDNLAHYPGTADNGVNIGGLVGLNNGGSIAASYATGAAAGGDGEENAIGGLVGSNAGGSITASYATGPAAGGDGDFDYVGGLVGWQSSAGSITASYATGAVGGGDGDEDYVGGLVGRQGVGFITASYATGAAAGGAGDRDFVGGLVGIKEDGSITASYGFGALSEGMSVTLGIHPTLTLAVQLTAENAGSAWNDDGSNTLGAWDFGDETQIPALKYADYDGGGDVFDCDHFPVDACGTLLLPGQRGGTGGGGTGGGGGGGGGSLGPVALVALALPLLLGRRRRRREFGADSNNRGSNPAHSPAACGTLSPGRRGLGGGGWNRASRRRLPAVPVETTAARPRPTQGRAVSTGICPSLSPPPRLLTSGQ